MGQGAQWPRGLEAVKGQGGPGAQAKEAQGLRGPGLKFSEFTFMCYFSLGPGQGGPGAQGPRPGARARAQGRRPRDRAQGREPRGPEGKWPMAGGPVAWGQGARQGAKGPGARARQGAQNQGPKGPGAQRPRQGAQGPREPGRGPRGPGLRIYKRSGEVRAILP